MNKTYIISLTIFLNLSYSVYRYYDYKNVFNDYEILNVKYLNLKKELDSEINAKNEEKYINQDDKVIASDSFFISMIYEISSISGLKLVSMSDLVTKDSDDKYTLNYIVFRFKGNMKMFYNFLYLIFNANYYIDTSRTEIKIDGTYFDISLGYLKGG
ncbi:MAG: hypothetical protein ACTTIS_01460 [Streptobacillus sp.]